MSLLAAREAGKCGCFLDDNLLRQILVFYEEEEEEEEEEERGGEGGGKVISLGVVYCVAIVTEIGYKAIFQISYGVLTQNS